MKDELGGWKYVTQILNDLLGQNRDDSTYRKRFTRMVGRCHNNSTHNVVRINADRSEDSEQVVVIPQEKLHDCEYLLRLHQYDPDKFELVSAQNSKWGNPTSGQQSYSSKIKVKPKNNTINDTDIRTWFEDLKRECPNADMERRHTEHSHAVTRVKTSDKMLLIPISDLHFGLLSSVALTGEKYNTEIAEQRFFDIIFDAINRTKNMEIDKIIFTIGGDMANADNIVGTTTKGTVQDQEYNYFEITKHLFSMVVHAIEYLAEYADVDVILINGNHDKSVGYMLSLFCEAWFKNDKRVTVDTSPLPRKYLTFGNTLFAFAHDGDVKKLPQLIADEARGYWSQVTNVEVFLQHLHTEMVLSEENHMRIQRLPTASSQSAWSKNQGYNSQSQSKCFVFDSRDGLTDVLYKKF